MLLLLIHSFGSFHWIVSILWIIRNKRTIGYIIRRRSNAWVELWAGDRAYAGKLLHFILLSLIQRLLYYVLLSLIHSTESSHHFNHFGFIICRRSNAWVELWAGDRAYAGKLYMLLSLLQRLLHSLHVAIIDSFNWIIASF